MEVRFAEGDGGVPRERRCCDDRMSKTEVRRRAANGPACGGCRTDLLAGQTEGNLCALAEHVGDASVRVSALSVM